MEELDVGFCSVCSSKIISSSLLQFWKVVCISAAAKEQWLPFDGECNKTAKYIQALEKKKFIVSRDHEADIYIRPHGVFKCDDGGFLVCMCPKEHFEHLTI